MRVALVTAAFRSRAPFDLHSHVRSLAPALARAGASVEVFCAVRGQGLAPLAQRRREVADHVGGATFGVTELELGGLGAAPSAEGPSAQERVAAAFGAFLDRERPTVVHFERVDPFGASIVREAKVRGIASVYSTSDTWPAHDRTSQTLPDLTPLELGNCEAEARARLAEAELGPIPAMGRFEDAVKDARLAELLHQPLTQMPDILALRDLREAVELGRAEKRVALSGVDRRFATSRLLAKELSAAVGRAFTFRAAGVDQSLFRLAEGDGPQPSDAQRKGAPRIAFIGSTEPTSGIDVLLDALAAVRVQEDAPEVLMSLYLECGDPARDALIAERAELLRIETRWTRGPADVAGAMARADVVALPTLWGEVSPTLCRIALAAGTPLIASRMPGVVESVPSSAAAFVAPGNVEELAAAITRLTGEGEQLDALTRSAREGAERTKSTEDEAAEWLETYGQIAAEARGAREAAERARGRSERPVNAAAAEVAASLAALRELSSAELFDRAQQGVQKLRKAFGLADTDAELLRRVVARGGDARDRAGEFEAMRDEVKSSLAELSRAREAMAREEAERGRRLADLHGVLGQYEKEVQSRGEEAARAARELVQAGEAVRQAAAEAAEANERAEALEGEASGLREERESAALELVAAKERFEQLARQADEVRTSLAAAEAEREEFSRTLEARDSMVRALRERLGAEAETGDGRSASELAAAERDLESIEAFCVALEQDARTLSSHDEWLATESRRLIEALEAAAGQASAGAPRGEADDEKVSFERGFGVLERLRSELDWRRREMKAAREASSSLRAKVLAGPLAARVQRWGAGAPQGTLAVAPMPQDRAEEALASTLPNIHGADGADDEQPGPLPAEGAPRDESAGAAEGDAESSGDDAAEETAEEAKA